MTRTRVFLALITGALMVASIGGVIAAAHSPSATKAKSVTVKLKDNFYSPNSKTIKSGTAILFKWAGENQHGVVATSVPKGTSKFHSKTQTGGTYTHKFSKKGKYQIECTVHGAMMFLNVKVT